MEPERGSGSVTKARGRSTMSTNKLLQSLSEDPQLEKQIGCMAGILQIFDRHQVLTGRKLYGHKRIAGIQSGQVSPTNHGGDSIHQETQLSDAESRNKPEEERNTVDKYKQISTVAHTPRRTGPSSQDPHHPQPQHFKKDDSMYRNVPSTSNRLSELPKTTLDPPQYPPYSLLPRRLDSSRSLHEPRFMTNLSNHEGKVNPRRSVDTAERAAAAAARGALKELSRIPDSALLIPDLLDNYDRGPPLEARPSRQGLANSYKPKPETPPRPSNPPELSESLRLLARLREAPTVNLGYNGNNLSSGHQKPHHQYPPSRPSLVDLAKDKETPSVAKFSYNRSTSRPSSYEPSRVSSVDFPLEGGLHSREIPRLSLDGRGTGFYKAPQKLHPKNVTASRSVSCSTSDCDTESNNEKRASFSSNVVAKLMGLEGMPGGVSRDNTGPNTTTNKMEASTNPSAMQTIRSLTSTCNSNISDLEVGYTSQCGKYVSPSFFPSKRRQDLNIAVDLEEDGEDDYLHFQDSLSQFNPSQSEADDLENPFHLMPKNHHFGEDCPPYMLSSAAKLCAQIEEMQRKDSWHKSDAEERRPRSIPGMKGQSKQDLEALRQLLGSIHLKSHYLGSQGEKIKAQSENSEALSLPGIRQFHNEQASQQAEWKPNRRSNYDDEGTIHSESEITYRRNPSGNTHHRNRTKGGSEATFVATDSSLSKHSSPEYYRSPRMMRETYCNSTYSSASLPRKPVVANEASNGRNGQSTINNRVATSRGVINRAMNSFTSPSSHQFPQKKFDNLTSPPQSPQSEGSPASMLTKESRNSKNYHGKHINKQLPEKTNKKAAIHKDIKEHQVVSLKPERKPSPVNRAVANLSSNSAQSSTRSRPAIPRSIRDVQSPESASKSFNSVQNSPSSKADPKVKRRINFSESELPEESRFDEKTNVNNHCKSSKEQVVQNEIDANFNSPTIESKSSGESLEASISTSASTLSSMSISPAERTRSSTNQLPTNVKTKCILRGDTACQDVGLNLLAKENDDTESQGDKSTGSCEQPSPISVLDGPFYHEEDISSPPESKEFKLNFKEDIENARLSKAVAQVIESVEGTRSVTVKSDQLYNISQEDKDYEYVKLLILRGGSARNKEEGEDEISFFKLAPLEPRLFLLLEGERTEKDGDSWRRKLLFDAANVSLTRQIKTWLRLQEKPWILMNQQKFMNINSKLIGCSPLLEPFIEGLNEDNSVRLTCDGANFLLREVWEEIGRGRGRLRTQRKWKKGSDKKEDEYGDGDGNGNGDLIEEEEEEDDDEQSESTFRLLEEDLRKESRVEWSEQIVDEQKGEIALDIERLIFKDLIHQILRDLGIPSSSSSTTSSSSSSAFSASSSSSSSSATTTTTTTTTTIASSTITPAMATKRKLAFEQLHTSSSSSSS